MSENIWAFRFVQRLFSRRSRIVPRRVSTTHVARAAVACFHGAGAQSNVREGSGGAGLEWGTNRKAAVCPPAHRRRFPNFGVLKDPVFSQLI